MKSCYLNCPEVLQWCCLCCKHTLAGLLWWGAQPQSCSDQYNLIWQYIGCHLLWSNSSGCWAMMNRAAFLPLSLARAYSLLAAVWLVNTFIEQNWLVNTCQLVGYQEGIIVVSVVRCSLVLAHSPCQSWQYVRGTYNSRVSNHLSLLLTVIVLQPLSILGGMTISGEVE